MTQNLKIEVLTGDISIDGMVVTNLVTKEELSTAIVKKADLGTDGKIPTSQLPAEIVNTAGIIDEVKLQLETSIKDAVDESNAYAESYTDNALSSKADLTSGKVPLEQLPAIDQYPQFGTALSNLSTSISTAMKQRTDQLEKTKADLGEDGKVLREQIPSYEKISGLPEQLEVMSTQTAAVSGELDQHKLQTADQIDTLKENIEANVQQLTDRQSHLMRTYATKELGVDAKVGVKPGEYFYVRSSDEDDMLVEYQNVGGVPTPTGKSYPSSGKIEYIYKNGAALPYDDAINYEENAIVVKGGELQQWNNGKWVAPTHKETVNVRNYGAVWNGNSNPVSDWYTIGSINYRGYANLAAVQSDYPFVSSGTDEIDFVATQAAANDALLKGAEVHLPQGTGVFNRTVNLTGFFGSHMTNLPVLHNKKLRFVGKGSANTIIKGGEVGYGFFEMLGANFIDFEGLTLNATNATNKCQYGICAGRPTGNASSGTYHFKDFHVYGFFTKAAHYMMSSETNVWEDCFYYPQTGHGVVLSMKNIGWNVTPKYTTFGTGLGGNGVNYMSRVHFLTHLQSAPSDILLAVEYGQVFRADTIYFASTMNEKHVQFRKSFGQTFINNAQHEQYGAVMPISYYFKGDDASDPDDYIDYRDFTLINSRLFQIYSEDNVRLTNANITNNVYRGPVGSLGIDLAKLYDSRIEGSDKMPNVTLNNNVKVRVRQENENNTWKGFKLENIDVPLLALDHVVLPTDSSKAGEISGLDTRLSTVQSGGSAPITAVGTSDFAIYLDFVAPTIIDAQQRGVISFAGASTNMGSGRVLGAYFVNGALFIEYLNTSSNIVTLRSTDASILQRLGGKRMSLIIMRSSGNIRAFINGYMVKMYQSSLVGSASFSESIDGTFLMIGNRNSNVNSVAKGVYYSAALFNAALSDDGALNVHRNGALIANTCVGYWMFNQSSGNTLKTLRGSSGSIYGDGNLAGVVAQTMFTKNISTEIVLTAGASNRQYITGATGAALGDVLLTSYDKYMNGALISADVSSVGTIEVTFFNPTAASVTIPIGNIKVLKM